MDRLDKNCRGSRPRCVLLCEGGAEEVARRLTEMVGRPEVDISALDQWQPHGTACMWEAELDKVSPRGRALLPPETREKLREWWLAEGGGRARTPKWEIAGTCTISGRKGLLLVEAKAHEVELSPKDQCDAKSARNRERIVHAIAEASAGLREAAGGSWQLSAAHHYQLANRFAWSWKLARLQVPVVLVYLGFLDAAEMNDRGRLFRSGDDWRGALQHYCQDVIDMSCWERTLDIDGTPILPLTRTCLQPFEPPQGSLPGHLRRPGP